MEKIAIAISGLPGAGSTTTAKLLAEKLKIEFFSPGQLFKDIAKGKIEQQKYFPFFKEALKKRDIVLPNFSAENDSEAAKNLWQTEIGKNPHFHEILDELQIKLANLANIIIDGKLSLIKIKNANLKIWLTASLEERAKRTAERDELAYVEALELVKNRQEIEREEWKKIYSIDYFEQEKIADLIIDTTKLSPQEVIEIISDKLIAYQSNKLS